VRDRVLPSQFHHDHDLLATFVILVSLQISLVYLYLKLIFSIVLAIIIVVVAREQSFAMVLPIV